VCGLPITESIGHVRLTLTANDAVAVELSAALCEVCCAEAAASMPAAIEILREAAEELLDDAGGEDE
jgi:hypothetical protein